MRGDTGNLHPGAQVFTDAESIAAKRKPEYDEVGQIIAYEQDLLNEEETIELFQHLVDNGHAWTLQGHYGKTAEALIKTGFVKR